MVCEQVRILLVASLLLAGTGCGFGGTRETASIWDDTSSVSAESMANRATPVPPAAEQPRAFPPPGQYAPGQVPQGQYAPGQFAASQNAPSQNAPGQYASNVSGPPTSPTFAAGYEHTPPAQIVQPGAPYASRYPTNSDPTGNLDPTGNSPNLSHSQASSLEKFAPARIVAQVGDQYILAGDVLGAVTQMLEPHRDKLTEAQYNEQKERGIEAMVRRMLESKLMYVSFLQQITKDKVAEAIVGVREEAFKQYDEKELDKAMKQAKVSTPGEFDAYLRRFGTSLYKQKIQYMEGQLGRTAVMQNIELNPEITHQEMLDYYRGHLTDYDYKAKATWEKLTARHDAHASRSEARYAIGVMGDQVRLGGAPLSAVAKRSSNGLDKREGGFHEWTTRGSLRSQQIDEAIFTLPPNLLSDIIEDETGFHIVRVIERQPAGRTSFIDAQVKIRKTILNQKRQDQVVAYTKRLREEIPVWTVFDDELRPTAPSSSANGSPVSPQGGPRQ